LYARIKAWLADVTVAAAATIATTGWWWCALIFVIWIMLLPPFMLLLPLLFPFFYCFSFQSFDPHLSSSFAFMSSFVYCLRCAADVMWKKHKKELLY
jgi:hypothetical protein